MINQKIVVKKFEYQIFKGSYTSSENTCEITENFQ